ISWHPTQDDVLVSASLDHTVKRWRVEPNQPTEEYAHLFASEVAGAEYLPFGEALLVTQRSADHSAVVIRDDAELTVVHEFVGLASPLLGSAWRSRWDASRARHQLVTWEKDQVLRMWAVGDSTVAAAGGGARQRSEMPAAAAAAAPSFATNFLQPEQLLHLLDQKAMDSGLLLAATAAADGGATTWHELARTGRLARASAAPAWRTGLAPARASTSDEHTSDDDNTPTTTPTSKIKDIAAPTAWREEVESVVLGRYRQSGTVTLCDPNTVGRLRRLQVGVPWITDEAVELDVLFPQRYPRAPLRIAVDAVPAVFGAASALADLAAATADACAELGVPALDRCLHAVLAALVEAARSQKAHAEGDRAEDAERIPPPLPPLQATPARQRTGHVTVAARLFGRPPAA
ncbi:GATOR complex protein wdr59, partial [Coemansia nantahalensis]